MDANAKKTAFRMIPYGLYVLTGRDASGRVAAATVNWVTQASFEPPLVAVGVKADSTAHAVIKQAGAFALNVLAKGQQKVAFAFFKSVEPEGQTLAGEPFRIGGSGAPLLERAAARIECRLVQTVEKGDHSLFLGEVIEASLSAAPAGRPDDATLALRDLGDSVFYGG
jgi:flavin reductase (DIM6/NTAB) family NADH-FMN oxidoreductase RutF